MDRLSRRRFLNRAIAAGVGATILETFPAANPSTARAAPAEMSPGYDPGFVAGQVMSVTSDGVFTALNPDGALERLRLTSATSIWREGAINGSLPATTDCVYARGTRDANGVLIVETMWCNIIKVDGQFQQMAGGAASIKTDSGKTLNFAFGDNTDVVLPDARVIQAASPTLLTAGGDLSAIGYFTPDGSYHLTRAHMASATPSL